MVWRGKIELTIEYVRVYGIVANTIADDAQFRIWPRDSIPAPSLMVDLSDVDEQIGVGSSTCAVAWPVAPSGPTACETPALVHITSMGVFGLLRIDQLERCALCVKSRSRIAHDLGNATNFVSNTDRFGLRIAHETMKVIAAVIGLKEHVCGPKCHTWIRVRPHPRPYSRGSLPDQCALLLPIYSA